jgi:fatty-acyl-CoA synthase
MNDEKTILQAREKYRSVYTNPLTPLSFLKRCEQVFPNKTAVVYREKSWTWKQFAERVYRLSNGLKAKGIGKNDRVAILCRNDNANLEAFYGVPFAGAVHVPLNYRLGAKEIAYILNHSGAKVLIMEHAYSDALQEVREELDTLELILEVDSFDKKDGMPASQVDWGKMVGLPYEEFITQASPAVLPIPPLDECDMISICYTSGTTGLPKGCVHTHRGSYLNALGEVIEAQLKPESSYLWTLPMFHSQGWCFVYAVTVVGAKHVCLDAVRAEEIYRLMAAEQVTHMCGAPTACSMITDYMLANKLKFPNVVRGFIAGAPPTYKNFVDGWSIGLDLHQVYGLTEVYGPHTVCEWNEGEWGKLSDAEKVTKRLRQGVPYATVTNVRVTDQEMKDVPMDGKTVGEIVMQGNNTMQWYFRETEKTNEAFAGGWFHSGDAAVMDPDGYVRIVDRFKDIVVTGGEKVASVEVEAVLTMHPDVADAAVVGKPDPKWGEIVKAMVKLKPGASITEKDLIAFCKTKLAGFKTPREIEFGDIPRTATGKIQKNILKQRERQKAGLPTG